MSARKERNDVRSAAAKVIKDARQLEGVSQIRLAQLLGISQPLVSAWECGKVTPGIDDVANIERILDTEQGLLLFAIAYPRNNPNSEYQE